MSTGMILLLVLIIILVSTLPTWPHAANWGYMPGGIVGLILLVVLVLLALGRL